LSERGESKKIGGERIRQHERGKKGKEERGGETEQN